jgi:glycerol-3-phosphate acyltransferase PlsY
MLGTSIYLAACFLVGSVPFGLLLFRAVRKGDVREVGSGNIGATNVARAGGKGLGCMTLLLDASKGFFPVAIAIYLGGRLFGAPISDLRIIASLAALAAIAGHVFPPWLGFRGGKGVATALGAAIAFKAASVMPALIVFAVVVAITRYVSLGSILGALAVPLYWLHRAHSAPRLDLPYICAVWAAIALLVVIKHYGNIKRLVKGVEHKLF